MLFVVIARTCVFTCISSGVLNCILMCAMKAQRQFTINQMSTIAPCVSIYFESDFELNKNRSQTDKQTNKWSNKHHYLEWLYLFWSLLSNIKGLWLWHNQRKWVTRCQIPYPFDPLNEITLCTGVNVEPPGWVPCAGCTPLIQSPITLCWVVVTKTLFFNSLKL